MVIYISTPEQLQAIQDDTSAHYELTKDIEFAIDYTNGNFIPISYFSGIIDGNGHVIRNLVIFNRSGTDNVGFINDNGGTIKNLGLENVYIEGTKRYGGSFAGTHSGSIENCWSDGTVRADTHSNSNQTHYGGMVGRCFGTITNSFSSCMTRAYDYSGGFIGYHIGGEIKNCYTTGMVANYISTAAGKRSAFANYTGGTLTNCYYNKDTSNWTTDTRATGLNLAQMRNQASFPAWDFDTVWQMNTEGDLYPVLKVFYGEKAPPAQDITVEVMSHLNVISSMLERSKRKVSIRLSHVAEAITEATRFAHVMKDVTSHIDEIVSEASSFKNANMREYQVTSHLEGIGSNAERLVRTIRTVESDVKSIQVITEIVIPIDVEKPVYASVYVMENPTAAVTFTNKTTTTKYENRTETSVI